MHPTTAQELPPRKRAKMEQIREGAQALFLKRGFAESTTDAIARRAGVSKQTLYVYYPTKEELLADVLRHLIEEGLSDRLPDVAEETSLESRRELREALLSLASGILASVMQPHYLALVRVIVAETPRLPQLGNLFRQAVAERALESVSVLLERARKTGVIQVEDRDAASRLLVGSLLTHAILDGLLVAGSPRRPESERIEAIVDLYVKAVT